MKLFPAIDILDGKAVRLVKGDRKNVTVYGDPVDMAYKIAEAGSKFLHVVDLNAAFDGTSVNEDYLREIANVKNLTTQLGGGMRTAKRVGYVLETLGLARAIVGSALVTDEKLTQELYKLFGNKVVAGLDVKDGHVAIKGWVDTVKVTPTEVAKRIKAFGASDVVFTDISRDGALSGVNVPLTHKLQVDTGLNVIASGGLSSINDISELKQIGIYGAILGKAMYEGKVTLKDALACAN